mmetsp:Transcript_1361/g.5169  ORF Transcript_1361/g.5169 Transcript_1361/m.5169 type:complete len:503 (+) Transcript_1361:224-1732(+)
MEIERELTFEDMSVHSPGAFSKGDAMRQLRTAPNAHSLRVALAELDQTSQSLTQMLNGAKEKALGNSDKDLERIKNNVKRMKFGTVELGTECAFLRSVLESALMPSAQNPPRETAAFVNANAAIKVLKDSNDREAKTVELLTQEVGAVAEQFQKLHETLTRRIEHLEQMEEKCELAESGLSDADLDAANGAHTHPEDQNLSLEQARAHIEALDAETKAVRNALRTRTAEVTTMAESLNPAKQKLKTVEAELRLFTGADTLQQRELDASSEIAETSAVATEQRLMIQALIGCEIVECDSEKLAVAVTTKIPQTQMSALEPVDGTPASKAATLVGGAVPGTPCFQRMHLVEIIFHPGSTAVKSVSLTPGDVPIDDVVASVVAAGACEKSLQSFLTEIKMRVAATSGRTEALTRTAAQTPMEWSAGASLVRVGLYSGTGGVAAMDVPLEWPMSNARVRVVGLAGLPPAVVAAAAPKVDPGGYTSIAAALRATQDALAGAGHVPTV